MTAGWIKPFFAVAALYDFVLGVCFLFFAGPLLSAFGIEPPNHPGYLQFPAAMLLVFAAMLGQIAMDPIRNRNLIPYGMGLKVAYCGTVFWNLFTGTIPAMWKPLAWADLGFLVLFVVAWRTLGAKESAGGAASSRL